MFFIWKAELFYDIISLSEKLQYNKFDGSQSEMGTEEDAI